LIAMYKHSNILLSWGRGLDEVKGGGGIDARH